ncbi:MAG: LysE family translocator [Hyphomicrobiales bacterium]
MTLLLFSQIVFVCLLGAMSPGPSMIVVVNNAVFKDRLHGILTAIGHGLGIGIYAICAVLGIGLIIQTNLMVFNGIKLLSIMFLLYLGIQSIRSRDKLIFEKNEVRSKIESFGQGFTISILNPKIFIWFVAIYSHFMSNDNNLTLNISLILIASTVDALWYNLLDQMVTSQKIFKLIKMKYNVLQPIIGYLLVFIAILVTFDMFVL